VSDGRFSISHCFSPDGLRRSAFNSTPLGIKPTEAKKSSIERILRGDQRIGLVERQVTVVDF
jgi:hypothetical protein